MNDLRHARSIAEIAVMAAVIIVLGLVPPIYVLGSAVPITAQTLGVMLAGAILGARRGAGAATIVVVIAAAGLPVLSGGRGGLGVLTGPTAGFLIGWIPGAFVTGALTQQVVKMHSGRIVGLIFAAIVGGVGVVYAAGALWLIGITRVDATSSEFWLGLAVFLPGDLVKAVLAGFIALAVHRQRTPFKDQ